MSPAAASAATCDPASDTLLRPSCVFMPACIAVASLFARIDSLQTALRALQVEALGLQPDPASVTAPPSGDALDAPVTGGAAATPSLSDSVPLAEAAAAAAAEQPPDAVAAPARADAASERLQVRTLRHQLLVSSEQLASEQQARTAIQDAYNTLLGSHLRLLSSAAPFEPKADHSDDATALTAAMDLLAQTTAAVAETSSGGKSVIGGASTEAAATDDAPAAAVFNRKSLHAPLDATAAGAAQLILQTLCDSSAIDASLASPASAEVLHHPAEPVASAGIDDSSMLPCDQSADDAKSIISRDSIELDIDSLLQPRMAAEAADAIAASADAMTRDIPLVVTAQSAHATAVSTGSQVHGGSRSLALGRSTANPLSPPAHCKAAATPPKSIGSSTSVLPTASGLRSPSARSATGVSPLRALRSPPKSCLRSSPRPVVSHFQQQAQVARELLGLQARCTTALHTLWGCRTGAEGEGHDSGAGPAGRASMTLPDAASEAAACLMALSAVLPRVLQVGTAPLALQACGFSSPGRRSVGIGPSAAPASVVPRCAAVQEAEASMTQAFRRSADVVAYCMEHACRQTQVTITMMLQQLSSDARAAVAALDEHTSNRRRSSLLRPLVDFSILTSPVARSSGGFAAGAADAEIVPCKAQLEWLSSHVDSHLLPPISASVAEGRETCCGCNSGKSCPGSDALAMHAATCLQSRLPPHLPPMLAGFGLLTWHHNCKVCGASVCSACSRQRVDLAAMGVRGTGGSGGTRLSLSSTGSVATILAESGGAPTAGAAAALGDLHVESGPQRVCDECARMLLQFAP